MDRLPGDRLTKLNQQPNTSKIIMLITVFGLELLEIYSHRHGQEQIKWLIQLRNFFVKLNIIYK